MPPISPDVADARAYLAKALAFSLGGWWPTRGRRGKHEMPRIPEQPPQSLTTAQIVAANRYLNARGYILIRGDNGILRVTKHAPW